MKEVESIVVIVKPDGYRRGLGGEIRGRFESALGTTARMDRNVSVGLRDKFERHYAEHKDKEFYSDLVREMSENGPVRVMMFRAPDAVCKGRAEMESIRTKYAETRRHNTVHCSDSAKAGYDEVAIWFA
jgi:nucleoside-diphosphate kinase